MPYFVSHRESSRNFLIDTTSDESLIGSYTITLRSEVELPASSSMTGLFVEYDIEIRIEPCQVTSFTELLPGYPIEYKLGGESLTDGYYMFEESPICEYPQTITVTNLPAFVEHDEFMAGFTIA